MENTQFAYKLIKQYIQITKYTHHKLTQIFNTNDPLGHYIQGNIPRTGIIQELKWKYSFHGVGCYILSKDFEIDYDYGYALSLGIFNQNRLFQFAKSVIDLPEELQSIEGWKHIFENLEKLNLIIKSKQKGERGHWRLTSMDE